MFSEAKNLSLIIVSSLVISVASCSSAEKEERKAVDALVQQASDAVAASRYDEAFALMDSVDHAYPKQIEARRTITKMRSQAMTDFSQKQLISTDSLLSVLNDRMSAMQSEFKHVGGGDLTGYYVAKDANNANFLRNTGIEARVDDEDYYFYIVAVNSGKPIGINQITICTPTDSYSSSRLPDDSERAGDVKSNGTDLATFMIEEVDSLAAWTEHNADAVNKVVLSGRNGETSVRITPAQARLIAQTWRFADVAARLQLARVLHDKYEQQLIIARDHTVNLE